jgi:predicted permease
LKPLPIERSEQLVFIPTREKGQPRITPEVYWRLRTELVSVEGLASFSQMYGSQVSVDGAADESPAVAASGDIFRVLRLSAGIGRLWTIDDETSGDTDVAVLGYRFWRQRLGGSRSILGETVAVNNRIFRVIGVLSEDSDHPEFDLLSAPVWTLRAVPRTGAESTGYGLIARLHPGVSPLQVAGDIERTVVTGWRPEVTRLLDSYTRSIRHWMLLALGVAGIVVLVACVNAANLMLTRSVGRAQEFAVRAALGASRRLIALTVVAEGLLLSLAAATVALALSVAGVHAARMAVTTMLRVFRSETIELNGRVFLAAVVAAMVAGLLCAVAPAWQTSRAPVLGLLKDAEAPTATGRRHWRSAFLITEIAMVSVLLVVSWLFVASLIRVVNTDLGIDRSYLLAVKPNTEYRGTVNEVTERLTRVPGVSDIAIATGASLPLIGQAFGGAWQTTAVSRPDRGAGSEIKALRYRVTPNYFKVAGLRFVRGGTWAPDTAASAIVLDDLAARQLFGDENPIGRPVRATEPEAIFTVVGTVPRVYTRGPEATDPPSAYFPLQPNPARTFAGLFVKTSRPPHEMLSTVTEALEPVAPDTKEPFVFPAEDALSRITATRRFNAGLMSIYGLLGVLIGAAGVYAVMAAFVAQQTREIGVRVALGATPARVQRGVLALAGRHLAVGLAIGLPAAWWLSRGFTALLFQVTPADIVVYLGTAIILTIAGVLAAWIPARRAARIDPILSLRR